MNQALSFSRTKTSYFLKYGLCIFFFLFRCFSLSAQSYDELNQLKGHQFKTYYSNGAAKHAKVMASRLDRVFAFYDEQIGFEPQVTFLALSPEDWGNYTGHPVYGMPHYTNNNTLIVASENNDFWKSFIPSMEQLSKELAEEIREAYTSKQGDLSLQAFFDLIAIHELGHAFHIQGGLNMQRKWMGELFSNIFLHTYIAEKEPELLPALTGLPKMVIFSTNKNELHFTTLSQLETKYDEITRKYPGNYGWYQSRLHTAAGKIYDEGGLEAFQNLWLALKNNNKDLNNPKFIAVLSGQVHQSVADVPIKWDE